MNSPLADEVERITAAILASAKYRSLTPALVRRVAGREWVARGNLREAEHAARRKLHQVAGAYWPSSPRYACWLEELSRAAESGPEAVREVCRTILAGHASTRERMPILPELYRACLADLAPITSVLDVACGLNPLACSWMPLAKGARYIACDVYTDLAAFLERALCLLGYNALGLAMDVLGSMPAEPVQVALLMKALPCLEQLDPAAARGLLVRLPTEHVLVSFPAHSLGGAKRGMPVNYEAHFRGLLAGESWRVRRYLWPSELVFRIDKS
ncbi:MAG: 16S rRNA methyltransferase [Chloroflexi bacterium]|nr:16S rRNA methyltransferase [Chloroflexota bacterium]